MTKIQVTETINASLEETFAVLNDFHNVHHWHPYVESVTALSQNNGGLNSERVCHFYNGQNFEEKIIEFKENSRISIAVKAGLPGIMARNDASISARRLSDTKTEVTMKMEFETKYWILGKLMGRFMMKPQFTKLGVNVLKGLKNHLETGKFIGKGGKLLERPIAVSM